MKKQPIHSSPTRDPSLAYRRQVKKNMRIYCDFEANNDKRFRGVWGFEIARKINYKLIPKGPPQSRGSAVLENCTRDCIDMVKMFFLFFCFPLYEEADAKPDKTKKKKTVKDGRRRIGEKPKLPRGYARAEHGDGGGDKEPGPGRQTAKIAVVSLDPVGATQ